MVKIKKSVVKKGWARPIEDGAASRLRPRVRLIARTLFSEEEEEEGKKERIQKGCKQIDRQIDRCS